MDRLRRSCKFIANSNYRMRQSLEFAGGGRCFRFGEGLATVVFAAATDLHHVRFLGILAILAAILTALFYRAIAGWMSARFFLVLCHNNPLLSDDLNLSVIL